MSRVRGNARKKKARLTERTLSAVMEVAQPRLPREPVAGDSSAEPEPVVASILELLRAEPDAVVVPAAYNDAGHIFTDTAGFPTMRYLFGLIVCPECRNEMVYYQDRDLLAAGYEFRCRICQHELLATLD